MSVSEGRNAGKTLICSHQVRIWSRSAKGATCPANTPFLFRLSLVKKIIFLSTPTTHPWKPDSNTLPCICTKSNFYWIRCLPRLARFWYVREAGAFVAGLNKEFFFKVFCHHPALSSLQLHCGWQRCLLYQCACQLVNTFPLLKAWSCKLIVKTLSSSCVSRSGASDTHFEKSGKKINVILRGEKNQSQITHMYILGTCLIGKWLRDFSLPCASCRPMLGWREMIRVSGACSWEKQDLGELCRTVLCCQCSSTSALLMAEFTQRLWSSGLLKLEASSPRQSQEQSRKNHFHPFLPFVFLRNVCAGIKVMRKRWKNWGVVTEDQSASADIVTRGTLV